MSHAPSDKQKQRGRTSGHSIDFGRGSVIFLGVYLEIKIFFLQKRRMIEGYLNQTRAGMLRAARPEKLARWVFGNSKGKKLVHAFS